MPDTGHTCEAITSDYWNRVYVTHSLQKETSIEKSTTSISFDDIIILYIVSLNHPSCLIAFLSAPNYTNHLAILRFPCQKVLTN